MASAWINIPTARYEGAEPMVVLGAAVRLSGFASHQLAEQLEQWEAQGARRHPRLALGAQHLELDRLGARAHPRRYRRPMPRAAPRGHSAGCRPGPRPLCTTRDPTRRGAETRVPRTLAPPGLRAHHSIVSPVLPVTWQCLLFVEKHRKSLKNYYGFSVFTLFTFILQAEKIILLSSIFSLIITLNLFV